MTIRSLKQILFDFPWKQRPPKLKCASLFLYNLFFISHIYFFNFRCVISNDYTEFSPNFFAESLTNLTHIFNFVFVSSGFR